MRATLDDGARRSRTLRGGPRSDRARCRVVILPGAHYSAQAPLLWFARELALSQGADVLSVRDEMPVKGDPFEWAQDRAVRALDFEPIQHCVVVGKSLASASAGLVADRRLAAVWITPLLDQSSVLDGLSRVSSPTMLLGGTGDETWRPNVLKTRSSIEIVELPALDHSLQVPGDPVGSLRALSDAVSAVGRFLATELAAD